MFLNPKTRRKVRTVHARFFERSRDSQEHIHMGSIIFERKHLVDGVSKSYMKCQLWPKVLWPGMDDQFTGDHSAHFPSPTDQETKDLDGIASDKFGSDCDMKVQPDSHQVECSTSQQPPPMDEEDLDLQIHASDDVDPPTVRLAQNLRDFQMTVTS